MCRCAAENSEDAGAHYAAAFNLLTFNKSSSESGSHTVASGATLLPGGGVLAPLLFLALAPGNPKLKLQVTLKEYFCRLFFRTTFRVLIVETFTGVYVPRLRRQNEFRRSVLKSTGKCCDQHGHAHNCVHQLFGNHLFSSSKFSGLTDSFCNPQVNENRTQVATIELNGQVLPLAPFHATQAHFELVDSLRAAYNTILVDTTVRRYLQSRGMHFADHSLYCGCLNPLSI